MTHTYDFAAIKQQISIIDGALALGLKLHDSGNSLRCNCPVCEDADRSLSLLPEKNTFRCFAANKSGSVIDLVAHVKQIGLKEAAKWLSELEEPAPEEEHQPLVKLPELDPERQDFLKPIIAKQVGIGYAAKGLMRGHVAIPLYFNGQVIGYIGIPPDTAVKLPRNLT